MERSPEEWIVPDAPDPRAILHEASAHFRAGEHELALAKHVWFHENALSIEPALYGVRLSFALSYWKQLAEVFPPAKEKLIETRQKAHDDFMQETSRSNAFHDLVSLNSTLNESWKTVDAFLVIHEKDRTAAEAIYNVAEEVLIEGELFDVCGQYVKPHAMLKNAVEHYQLDLQFEEQHRQGKSRPPETARPRFIQNVTTLIALLVKNDRLPEAKGVEARAIETLDDEEFLEQLKSAMSGDIPSQRY